MEITTKTGILQESQFVDAIYCLQVFEAIMQAVERTPHYPESHNLKGLVWEARFDYLSAAASYKLARCGVTDSSSSVSKSQISDITINLARSLSKVNLCLLSLIEFYSSQYVSSFHKWLYMCECWFQLFFFACLTRYFHLVQAGNFLDAVLECENLKKEGSKVSNFTCNLSLCLFTAK